MNMKKSVPSRQSRTRSSSKLSTLEVRQRSPNQAIEMSSTVSPDISNIVLVFGSSLFGRIVTFFGNQCILRHIAPSTYGIAITQLDFVVNILFLLARDPVRTLLARPLLSTSKKSDIVVSPYQRNVNISWLSIALGFLLAVPLSLYFLFRGTSDSHAAQFFITFILYIVAFFIEISAEPIYGFLSATGHWTFRSSIESLALFIYTTCLYTCVVFFRLDLLSFGISQIAYRSFTVFSYWYLYRKQLRNLSAPSSWKMMLPSLTYTRKGYLNNEDGVLLGTLIKQTMLKGFSTQFDMFLNSGFGTPSSQGTFAIVSSYGSLLMRLLFAPLEESARALFATNSSLLPKFLKFSVLANFVVLAFAPAYVKLGIHILVGRKWSSTAAPNLLLWYLVYVAFVSTLNFLDAYIQICLSSNLVSKASKIVLTCLLISVGYSVPLVKLFGNHGIVWASIISSILKIIFFVWIINLENTKKNTKRRKHTSRNIVLTLKAMISTVASWLPHYFTVAILFLSFLLTTFSLRIYEEKCVEFFCFKLFTIHCAVGAFMFLFACLSIYLFDKGTILILAKDKTI